MQMAYRGFVYESIDSNSTQLVYHGTNSDFSSFEKTTGTINTIFGSENVKREGFFFTPNKEFAKEFGSNVIACKLNVNNILDMNYGVTNEEDVEKLVSVGVNERYLRNIQPSTLWESFDGDDSLAPFIVQAGYDCVEMVEPNKDNRLEKVYVVFDKNKIEILATIVNESLERKPRKPSTPEFKDWVGYSKIPLQYHATDGGGFTEFDMHRSDLGVHVGTLAQAQKRMETKGGTGEILQFWVNIRNPLRLKDEGSFNADSIADQLVKRGIISKDLAKEINLAGYKGDKKYNEIVRNKILAAGYDGVVYKNTMEGAGDSYIVIDPTTIKSADKNSGKFDRTSPDFTQESISL